MPDLLFLDQLFPAIQDQLFQATPDQLSQLSPEPLEYGRERLRLSQRLMLMPFMESTHMDTTTLDFQPTPDQLSLATLGQLSPAMPDPLFPDQLFPAIQDQSFLATPDQLFLDTPASTDSVVCGKKYSHRTANRSSIAIQFKICCFYLNKLFSF